MMERSNNKRLAVRHPAQRSPVVVPISGNLRGVKLVTWCLMLIFLVVAGIGLLIVSAHNAEKLVSAERLTTLAILDAPLDEERAWQVFETSELLEDTPSFVLWEQRGSQVIENLALGRSVIINVVFARGDVSLIASGAHLPEERHQSINPSPFEGQMLEAPLPRASLLNRDLFCIIDFNTALTLFGDTNVSGLKLHYNDEDFIISAVIASARPVLITRSTEQSGAAYNMVTVANPLSQSAASQKESLAIALGLNVGVINFRLLSDLTHLVCWVPMLLLCILYLLYLLRLGFAKGNTTRQQVLLLLSFLASGIVFTVFVAHNVRIPRELVPSRFSDFSLWEQLFNTTRESLSFLFDAPVYVPTALYYDSFFTVIGAGAISLLAFLVAIWLFSHARFSRYSPRHTKKRGNKAARRSLFPLLSTPRLSSRRQSFSEVSLSSWSENPEDGV